MTGRRVCLVCVAIGLLSVAIMPEPAVAAPTVGGVEVSMVGASTAKLEASINPNGAATGYHFEYGTGQCSLGGCVNVPVPNESVGSGSSPQQVSAMVEGLSPGTVYHLRVVAVGGGTTTSPERLFATFAPGVGVADGRAYEQASPVDKDGGDAMGEAALVKAPLEGGGITFGSTFGLPGGRGAQGLPLYLARRGLGEAGWSTQGLFPPADTGERAQILGWLPDFSRTFSSATKLGSPRTKALIEQSTTGGPPRVLAPYSVKPEYAYVGADGSASNIFFEAQAKLPPREGQPPIAAALDGASNVYAWNEAKEEVSLASVFNDGISPPKGAVAGPYVSSAGISPIALREGGAKRSSYLQDIHAISLGGSVPFTALGSGQLYLRLNPTAEQSPLSAGACTDQAKACTLHVSASKRTAPDPAGPQPAAFQAAAADGSQLFFSSPEMLTDDANTGPEQPEASIGRADIAGSIEDEKFIPKKAVGVTVDGSYVYWADPVDGTIGRADLDGDPQSVDPDFIAPGEGECEAKVEVGFEEFEIQTVIVPSSPRYVAVDGEHIYWTNTGRTDANGDPVDGAGTIGRADLDGKAESVEPAFICGETETAPGVLKPAVSNPQGIDVSATHIYWANASGDQVNRYLGRASIGGSGVEPKFFGITNWTPYGVGVDGTHVYAAFDDPLNNEGFLGRVPLEGGAQKLFFLGKAGVRGLAVDASFIYWASRGDGALGRVSIEDFGKVSACGSAPSCEPKLTQILGSLNGLAADASHLYWSVNGEAPINPGNDLYRYTPADEGLEDLTALEGGNGAEVQGVIGASGDGSYLYFIANGDLDGAGPATAGNCQTTQPHGRASTLHGKCNLYLRHAGATILVARLNGASDAPNWVSTPRELFGTGSYVPRTSVLSKDGRALLFSSTERLTEYENNGSPEIYLYRADTDRITCVSCSPVGEAAHGSPSLGSIKFPGLAPIYAYAVESRNLSADGTRVFFETPERLTLEDTNGEVACPPTGFPVQSFPACLDVYEWEAQGSGSCEESSPAYAPLDEGCLYLISTGKSKYPSLFADASASGDDVFFFTRDRLVGQDEDELQDVYDARVGGGLSSQFPSFPPPCESGEACQHPAPAAPPGRSAASAHFAGPGDSVQKRTKPKHPKKKHKQRHKKRKKKRGGKKRIVARTEVTQ